MIDHPPSSLLNTGATIAMLAIIALLIGNSVVVGSSSSSTSIIPDGLLFASEMDESSAVEAPLFRGQGPFSSFDDGSSDSSRATTTTRRHPIHRIYHDNSHIRRRMEKLENSLPYFQTGIRGDPNHKLQYTNHPFDRMRKERELKDQNQRFLQELDDEENNDNNNNNNDEEFRQEDDPFQPIRIHFDTSALDSELTNDNGAQIDFVKQTILPRMRDYWSSALSVVRVNGNLLVSTAELQGRLYCGDTEFSKVPTDHISNGVPNADLVLYVSGAPSARFCGPSTLAVAVACNFDQFDRPTAGKFLFF